MKSYNTQTGNILIFATGKSFAFSGTKYDFRVTVFLPVLDLRYISVCMINVNNLVVKILVSYCRASECVKNIAHL